MKNYRDFEKINIGSSDIASLTVRSIFDVANVHFGADASYKAYEIVCDDVEIGNHYQKVFSGKEWLWIFDDEGKTYDAYHPNMIVDIYRAAEMGCIIHWHSAECKEPKNENH